MKRISKRDLITLKAGLAYYERDPESYYCDKCPIEELKSMLVQVSHSNGLKIANGIKEHGSYINTFNHRNYSYKKIWLCVTKTNLLY